MPCWIFIDGNVKKSRFFDFIITSEGSQRAVKRAFLSGFEVRFELEVTLKIFLEALGPQPRYLKYPPSVHLQADINYITHGCFKHIIFSILLTPLSKWYFWSSLLYIFNSNTNEKKLFEILHGHRKSSLEPLLCVIKQWCRYSSYSLGCKLSFDTYYESIRCLVEFLFMEMWRRADFLISLSLQRAPKRLLKEHF